MSKLLLVLEEHFFVDDQGGYWAKRIIDDEYLDRYLKVFDSVTIFARIGDNSGDITNSKKITKKNVTFAKMPDFHGPKELVFFSKKIIEGFRKQLEKCDVVILRSPSPLSLLLYRFIPLKKTFGVEFMMGADKFFEGKNIIHRTLNTLIDNEAKKLVLRANGVSYVTKEQLQKKYPCKAILNGTNNEYFTENYSSIDLNETFFHYPSEKFKDGKIKIIHVGFMDYLRKGQDILIRSLKLLIDDGYDIYLELVGDGKERKNFKKLAEDLNISNRIKFSGNINNKIELRKKLIDSDIFVLPSHSEGLPRVIIEAMACGLPVIASNVDGVPELIEKEYLVEDFNPNSYKEKIENIINSEDNMQVNSMRNFIFSKNYSAENLSIRRKDFYLRLKRLADSRSKTFDKK